MRFSTVGPILGLGIFLSGCISLTAPYDATYDIELNKLSQSAAGFLAATKANSSERKFSSKESSQFYAESYNSLDRLSARANLARSSPPCAGNQALKRFSTEPTSKSSLPGDYQKFDCRESQIYYVRYYLDQLSYGHEDEGVLTQGEANALGGQLQRSILGAIRTLLENKTE